MATTHSTITDPNIHEPKGVAEAAAATVYRANGSGSGTWEAPLKLIERRALTGLTSEEFTGLSQYRSLILVIESVTFGTATSDPFILQLSTASTYRTSGYYNQYINDSSNSTNADTTGIMLGYNFASATSFFGSFEINNFNVSYPTSVIGSSVTQNVNRINSSSTATTVETCSVMGLYPTAEAHAKIRLKTTNGYTMSSGFFTLYGI